MTSRLRTTVQLVTGVRTAVVTVLQRVGHAFNGKTHILQNNVKSQEKETYQLIILLLSPPKIMPIKTELAK